MEKLNTKATEKEWLKAEQIFKSHRKANIYEASAISQEPHWIINKLVLLKIHSIFWEIEIVLVSDEENRSSWSASRNLPKLTDAASRTKIQTLSQQSPQLMSHGHLPFRTLPRFTSHEVSLTGIQGLAGPVPRNLVFQWHSCWTGVSGSSPWLWTWVILCLVTPHAHNDWRSIAFRPDWPIYMSHQGGSTFIASKESRHPKLLLLDHGEG